MILHSPFFISARLLPALKVGDATLSADGCVFIFDFPDGREHEVDDFHPGASRDRADWFGSILCFLEAALESRDYRVRTGRPGENEDLFPAWVLDFFDGQGDEIGMLRIEIEESETPLIEE